MSYTIDAALQEEYRWARRRVRSTVVVVMRPPEMGSSSELIQKHLNSGELVIASTVTSPLMPVRCAVPTISSRENVDIEVVEASNR